MGPGPQRDPRDVRRIEHLELENATLIEERDYLKAPHRRPGEGTRGRAAGRTPAGRPLCKGPPQGNRTPLRGGAPARSTESGEPPAVDPGRRDPCGARPEEVSGRTAAAGGHTGGGLACCRRRMSRTVCSRGRCRLGRGPVLALQQRQHVRRIEDLRAPDEHAAMLRDLLRAGRNHHWSWNSFTPTGRLRGGSAPNTSRGPTRTCPNLFDSGSVAGLSFRTGGRPPAG